MKLEKQVTSQITWTGSINERVKVILRERPPVPESHSGLSEYLIICGCYQLLKTHNKDQAIEFLRNLGALAQRMADEIGRRETVGELYSMPIDPRSRDEAGGMVPNTTTDAAKNFDFRDVRPMGSCFNEKPTPPPVELRREDSDKSRPLKTSMQRPLTDEDLPHCQRCGGEPAKVRHYEDRFLDKLFVYLCEKCAESA